MVSNCPLFGLLYFIMPVPGCQGVTNLFDFLFQCVILNLNPCLFDNNISFIFGRNLLMGNELYKSMAAYVDTKADFMRTTRQDFHKHAEAG